MNNDKRALIIVAIMLLLLTYIGWVVDTYKPAESSISSGVLPKQTTQTDYELPTLSEQENAQTDSLHQSYVKQAESTSERKSIESMRDEVIKILDEVTEQDSTVTVSFNMQWTPSWVQ